MSTQQKTALLGSIVALLSAFILSGCAWLHLGETTLVDGGKPCADIVISEKSPRGVKLAASELQTYIEKISGAKLAITNAPGPDVPAHIYVGRSAYTDTLKITAEGLTWGAFRMVSGKDWLVLLGYDKEFVAPPYVSAGKPSYEEWDKRTGEHWGNPYYGGLYRQYSGQVGVNINDDLGSLNAVCEFLRGLGVRWYMPGDLGEIVPTLKTIALAPVDKTVRPDFGYRNLGDYAPVFAFATRDEAIYKLHIGLNSAMGLMGGLGGVHGLNNVNGRDEVKKAHPEFYANHRTPDSNDKYFVSCLSSPEFCDYTVKYARAAFDIYPNLQSISIWPNDGYGPGNMCKCDLCKGKETSSRGNYGVLSDYVWGFVERVAREVYKTHPDRKVICGAYGAYTLPPEKIAKFSPNVMVCIKDERHTFNNPEARAKALEFRKGWVGKVAPGNLCMYEHYLYGSWRLPVYFPHAIAEDLRSLKGLSQGESVELLPAWPANNGMADPGFNHLNVYVTARYYWDADQDIAAMLSEYYEKFYGPAAREMKVFIEFSEANWNKMSSDAASAGKAVALLEAARMAAGDTVYGKRIEFVADYCQKSLTALHDRLAKDRKDVPRACIPRQPASDSEITIDGRLDEPRWNNGTAYDLAEVETGQCPFGTSFQLIWGTRAIYFGIRCEEPDIQGLNIATTNRDDAAMFKGDYVEVLLETQNHSYYQIAVNPAGAIFDADLKGGTNLAWSSSAQIAVFKGDTFWSVEMRIPVGDAMDGGVDPMKSVEGYYPSDLYPWAFNVCRQRVSSTETERSAWSPTGMNAFHVPLKFGTLSDVASKIGLSGCVTGRGDYLSDRKAALALVQAGSNTEALAAFTNMAANASSEPQKSDALAQAFWCADRMKQYDRALELAKAIPLQAIAKNCLMTRLYEHNKFSELIAEFKTEDIERWPMSVRGTAFFIRGRAFNQLKDGPAAAADLKRAAEYSRDPCTRGHALVQLGDTCRDLLKDDQKALAAYAETIQKVPAVNGSYYDAYFALLSAVDILRKQGKYDEALDMLGKIDLKTLAAYGSWVTTFCCAHGETLAGQGKKAEAIAKFNEALGAKGATAEQKAACEKRIKELQGKTE